MKSKIILLVLIILSILIMGCTKQEEEIPDKTDELINNTIEQPISENVNKVFIITGENFKFKMENKNNPDLIVKEGEKVRIEFTSTDGFHDLVIDEFQAKTQKVRPGTPTFVEFIASKKGTFEYYCSVGSHRQQGMKGNLIIE